jgi:hypothetical protein
MRILVREARKEDAQQMLNLYTVFAREFVGPASRTIKTYKRMLRRIERINWVAVNERGKMVGYVSSRFDKRQREGRIDEIVVDPNHDFEQVAKPLIDASHNTLLEKKPAIIVARSLRNPQYEKIFPTLGFFASESTDVFMYAILNTQRFLNELAPVFVSRLKKIEKWNGLTQIECEGHSLILSKTKENVEPIVWTNQPVDFKVILTRDTLTKLIFSVADPLESLKSNKLRVETTVSQEVRNNLLRTLFPRRQFLIMDYW